MDERHDPPAPLLRLHLLDGFRVVRDGGPPLQEKWPRPSARALVKLLAVTPDHRLHREQVMDICWPGIEPQAAVGSLRVALHAARHALEPELAPRAASSYLVAEGPMLALDPATVWIDVDHAETSALAALATTGRAEDEALARALALFTGDLLPEDRYEPWTDESRARVTALRDRLRLRLAEVRLEAGEHRDAVALAEQVLAGSPAEESAHRIVIEAALRQGLRRQAVAQYHRCRRAMDAELGVRPGPAIEQLHREALTEAPARVPAAPGLPAPVQAATAAPLRGREAVLDRLADPGRPPVVLLTGEAGVGKTRLAAEAAARAARSGAAVLWGVGREPGGGAPYGMFAEALDRWFAGCDGAERADVGAEYPELAALLPSLGQVPAGGERTPEEERDGLFRAGALVLGALAAERPVLVVLDDLQAGDAGTFRLLGHLARHASDRGIALSFLATYRAEELPDADPRRKVIASLVRQGLCATEWLDGLDQEACLAMVRDAVPSTAGDEDTVRRAWRLSRGNPLFALELARGSGGSSNGTSPDSRTPDGVGQVVGLRLDRLDVDTRRVVEALAVVGGEAALTELLDIARHGLEPPIAGSSVADAVERAIAASLIEERQVVVSGHGEDGLAFRHPVVRSTCYERLSGVRRRQLHAAVAEAVLRRRPDAVDTLAVHFARADDPRAGEYLRRAAERAAALYANDAADRYYRDLVNRLDVDAARARLAHGQVLYRMGQFGRAAETLRLAIDELGRRGEESECILGTALLAETLLRLGDVTGAAEVLEAHRPGVEVAPEAAANHALARSILLRLQGHYTEGYAAARRALASAEETPGAARHGLVARAYASQASNLGLAGRFAESRAAADRALAPAEAYGEPTLLGAVLSTLRENARRHGQLRQAVEFGDRALELALRSGDPSSAAFERANLSEIRLLLDEGDTARELAEQAVTAAEWEETWCLPYALAALAAVRSGAGRHDDAAALLARAEETVTAAGDLQARQVVRTALAEHHLATGDPEAALAILAEDGSVLVARAQLAAGRLEEARSVAAAEVDRARRSGEHLDEVDAGVVLAQATWRTGDVARARDLLAEVEQLAEGLPYPAGRRRALEAGRALVTGG